MLKSMTGFGNNEGKIGLFGKLCVELRSTNHKFAETVFHLPEGFLPLEDRIKKEIDAKIKRGRIVCRISIVGNPIQQVYFNKVMLKNYINELEIIKKRFLIKDNISINTLSQLPGVLTVTEDKVKTYKLWPRLKAVIKPALQKLEKARVKEGEALYKYLSGHAQKLKMTLRAIKTSFKKIIKEKIVNFKTDEERSSFLKNTDISEEIGRLEFHILNFIDKLNNIGPVGKELDFIAQEMQREANTVGAKSCDAGVSLYVVKLKSEIEKVREQVQNIE